MRTIIFAAALLTAGSATAQTASPPSATPFTPHETEDTIKIITAVGCLTQSKEMNQLVNAVPDGSTVISSDGRTFVRLPDGNFTLLNSPALSDDEFDMFTRIALYHQQECNAAIKQIKR